MEILVLNFSTLDINTKTEILFHNILIMFFIGGKGRRSGVDCY